jgi:hypothetical protein
MRRKKPLPLFPDPVPEYVEPHLRYPSLGTMANVHRKINWRGNFVRPFRPRKLELLCDYYWPIDTRGSDKLDYQHPKHRGHDRKIWRNGAYVDYNSIYQF